MTPPPGFSVGWEAAATAQIELFSPGAGTGADSYRLKYTAPFRATIRPPIEELKLGSEELEPIQDSLKQLVTAVDARGGGGPGQVPPEAAVLEHAELVGGQLLSLILPPYVQAELRAPEQFVEVGIDEALVEYPWELMHDEEEFLCLKHFVGRFVNSSKPAIPTQRRIGVAQGPLSVLIVSVPQPQPRGQLTFEPLIAAEAETNAIVEKLAGLGGVKVSLLKGPKATYDEVYKALRGGPYHIVHFNGHAFFRDDKPHLSGIVLFDRDLTTGPIVNFLGVKAPIFLFMNACDTAAARGTGAEWRTRYDIFGLARAFLETGAYLIGTRWKVGDEGAAAFAKEFYSALAKGTSLGRAIRDARVACKAACPPDDFSWASYVFYGDPRLTFALRA